MTRNEDQGMLKQWELVLCGEDNHREQGIVGFSPSLIYVNHQGREENSSERPVHWVMCTVSGSGGDRACHCGDSHPV